MTVQAKNIVRFSFGSVLNALTAVSAHIPCCGSQLLIGIFGAQTLGAISTSYIYEYQFLMPIVISVFFTGLLMVSRYLPRKQYLVCNHLKTQKNAPQKIRNFFILNLLLGYLVVSFLYFFIPPHKHHIIDIHTNGYLIRDGQDILVSYEDDTRAWPWSKRIFISRINQFPTPARELFWYNFQSEKVTKNLPSVPVHFYARPTVTWWKKYKQKTGRLEFYITIKE
jgi:hypothetical protein